MRSFRSTRLATLLVLPAAALASAAPAWGHAGHPGHRMPAGLTMWAVGTATDPLVMRAGGDPLLDASARNRPGTTSHGTLGSAVVAGLIADRRDAAEADAELARRAALSTAQATRKLSRRCQVLIKKRASRLTKADRKRRTACLAQRRNLIARAKDQATPTPTPSPTPAPGVSAPAPPVQGPAPTTAPPSATPAPVAGGPTPVPTPASTPSPCPALSDGNPVYGAVGVTATEGAEPFRLTRACITADIAAFEFINTDSQPHDLFIAPADADGNVSGTPQKVFGRTPGRTNGANTVVRTEMSLKPGRYRLICTVPGHGKMEVGFTVYAPR